MKKIAIVTGASRGIGKSIAKKLSKNNIIVIGTSTNNIGKDIINHYLKKNGYGVILNLNNFNEINQLIKSIIKEFGQIDILINNAAIKHDKLFINMKYQEWRKTLKINLDSIFCISKLIIKNMIQKKYGRIIHIGSVIGDIGNVGQINYSATKSGIIGFNKTLALETARYGITSNVISPGFINTGMTKNLTPIQKNKYLLNIPAKKFGTKEDISSAVLFLSSKSASYITGQTIHINGGMYMN